MKMTSNMKMNEDELKNEDGLKNEDVLKNWPTTQQQLCPNLSYYNITQIFFKTSHLYSHTTNDVNPEMLSGVQTGNRIPHDDYNERGNSNARASVKDHIFMQRKLVQSFWRDIF